MILRLPRSKITTELHLTQTVRKLTRTAEMEVVTLATILGTLAPRTVRTHNLDHLLLTIRCQNSKLGLKNGTVIKQILNALFLVIYLLSLNLLLRHVFSPVMPIKKYNHHVGPYDNQSTILFYLCTT